MNYYITHCDINFLKYAERLFETLSIFSDNKIIFYTIDFNYKSKFNNVIPIQVSSRNYLQDFVDYSKHSSKEDAIKASEAEAQENAARFARTMKKPSRPVKNYGNKA